MRKVVLFNMVTLDGFFEGPNGDIGWHRVDEEFNDFAIQQLNSAGGLIFGRVTYQLMSSYWPTPSAISDDPIIAEKMNHLPKYVFSRTLETTEWDNTRLVNAFIAEEVMNLKRQPGGDLFIFGSADLAASFIEHGLIDEFRIMLNPVIIGRGRTLFRVIQEPLSMMLLETRPFKNGNVLLVYQPEKKET